MDFRLLRQAGGALDPLRYPLIALAVLGAVLLIYLSPVMAAFEDTLAHLLRNALFFAVRKLWKVPVILFFNIFPLYLTYSDPQMMPLYAFIWPFFGFGAAAMLNASLLLPEMKPYLPRVDAFGNFLSDDEEDETLPEAEEEPAGKALRDMEKLGM